MKVTIRVKGRVDLDERSREAIISKLQKFDQYFKNPEELEAFVLLKEYDDYKAVEITIPTKNIILRAEVKEETFMNAADAAVAKLDSQIRRHKSKLASTNKRKEGLAGYHAANTEFDLEKIKTEIMVKELVKNKSIELTPMTVDEALLQMDMLDHKFYIFLNSETNKVCVVYLREDQDYGIIEVNM